MKHLFLMATMLLMFGAANAQISDIKQNGSIVYVYGENNKELSRTTLYTDYEVKGWGNSFFVVQKNTIVMVYDQNCKEGSRMTLSSEKHNVKSASGNSFNVSDGIMMYTYDKNCKEISRRNL